MTPDLLRLMAYCMNAAARKALKWNDCRCVYVPCRTDCVGKQDMPDPQWVTGLIPLYEAAAPRVACHCLWGQKGVGHFACMTCLSTGKNLDPHALLRLAVAVGWACWKDGYENSNWIKTMSCADYDGVRRALKAADAYVKDPTEKRMEDCYKITAFGVPDWSRLPCFWADNETTCEKHGGVRCECLLSDAIQSAIGVLGRESLARVAVETLTEECPICAEGGGWADQPEICQCNGTGRVSK